jgi:hypothetical protein
MRQINPIAKAVGAAFCASHRSHPIYCTNLGRSLLLSGYQCERSVLRFGALDPACSVIF